MVNFTDPNAIDEFRRRMVGRWEDNENQTSCALIESVYRKRVLRTLLRQELEEDAALREEVARYLPPPIETHSLGRDPDMEDLYRPDDERWPNVINGIQRARAG